MFLAQFMGTVCVHATFAHKARCVSSLFIHVTSLYTSAHTGTIHLPFVRFCSNVYTPSHCACTMYVYVRTYCLLTNIFITTDMHMHSQQVALRTGNVIYENLHPFQPPPGDVKQLRNTLAQRKCAEIPRSALRLASSVSIVCIDVA